MPRLVGPPGYVIEITDSRRARGKSLEAVGVAAPPVAASGTGDHLAAIGDGRGRARCIHAGSYGESADKGEGFFHHFISPSCNRIGNRNGLD